VCLCPPLFTFSVHLLECTYIVVVCLCPPLLTFSVHLFAELECAGGFCTSFAQSFPQSDDVYLDIKQCFMSGKLISSGSLSSGGSLSSRTL